MLVCFTRRHHSRSVRRRRECGCAAALLAAAVFIGCAGTGGPDLGTVSSELERRVGHVSTRPSIDDPPRGEPRDTSVRIPDGISLADGLTQEEAVALALWNHPGFRADLATLGFARADLLQAGLLSNPVLSVLFPLGSKQLEATLGLALEAIWERPIRLSLAHLEVERVAQSLIQTGLDTALQARLAYTTLVEAERSAQVAERQVAVQNEIARIVESRVRVGDLSDLEAQGARMTRWDNELTAARAVAGARVARHRLRYALGLGSRDPPFEATPVAPTTEPAPVLERLRSEAFAARPDVHAAALALEAAGERAGWEPWRILKLVALADANDLPMGQPLQVGPGLSVEIPLFDQNQGGIARADAAVEEASWRYQAARTSVALEVAEAHTDHELARTTASRWNGEILPSLESALRRAERSFETGDTSRQALLEMTALHLAAQRNAIAAEADLRRATAQLERSVGMRIGDIHAAP